MLIAIMRRNVVSMLGAASAAIISLSVLAVSPAISATITYFTPTGATTGGGPVNASATFTTGTNSITVTLSNLQPNITDVAQGLSDLFFTYSGPNLPGQTLTNSSGQEISVASGGSPTIGPTVSTGWALSSPASNELLLNVLNTPIGPAHVIIGPPDAGGTYSNANGSIAGNGPHNPFLNETAMFVISLTGITADTTITSAIFSFGTTAGINVPGVPSTVPLPGALPLFATGIGLMGVLRWKKKRKAISA
jgi:hypothetical protein